MFDFIEVVSCNMCGAGKAHQKFLGRRLNSSQGWRPSKIPGITVSVFKCGNCGLVYCNPMPLPQDLSALYNMEPDKYWKTSYFEMNNHEIWNKSSIIEEVTKIEEKMKLLDIGAGIGKQMKIYESLGIDCFGIEPSKSFYEFAISKMKIDASRLQCASVYDAEFPLNHFDFINCSAVLEHLPDPNGAINKMIAWLKPNGFLFISVPYSKWLIGRVVNLVYKIKGDDFVTNLCPMHPPYHLFEFGATSFEKNAVINNYEVAKIHHVACETFLPKIIDPFFTWIMKQTNSGMEINVWLKKKS